MVTSMIVLIIDLNDNEHTLETQEWNEVLSFVKMYKGKIKTFTFKNKQEVVMKFNYQKLKGKIIEKYHTQKTFAKMLKINPSTLSQKNFR